MMFSHMRQRFPLRAIEWQCACMVLSWGLILAMPGDTFATSRSYDVIENLVSEGFLSAFMTACGCAWIGGLFVNGFRARVTPIIRILCAAVGFLIFLLITFGLLLANPISTAMAVYPWLALSCAAAVYRAATDR